MIVRALALAIVLASLPSAALSLGAAVPATVSTVLKMYCASCHSGPARAGVFSLDGIDANHPAEDVEAWERPIRQLRAHTMPVMGAARPDSTTYDSTISALIGAIDRSGDSASH